MALFGEVLYLYSTSGTVVFVAVMLFLTLFEVILHFVEAACAKRGYKGLVKKLYREFMIMGFVSFGILLATDQNEKVSSSQWYQSFHFAHIVILFIGITFFLQAILLVSLISARNKTLLSHDNSTSEDLAMQFVHMHANNDIRRFMFDYGPITLPFPELRERIEYKMLQEFFINAYNLPREFKFANYMCSVLQHYIISLVEVRPINWVAFGLLIGINYLRIAVIDPVYQAGVCHRYPAHINHHGAIHGDGGEASSSGHRFLTVNSSYYSTNNDTDSGVPYGERVCNEYTLRYIFTCCFLMFFFLLFVLLASEVYIGRLIDIVLDDEETLEAIEDGDATLPENNNPYDHDIRLELSHDDLDHDEETGHHNNNNAIDIKRTSFKRNPSVGGNNIDNNNNISGRVRRNSFQQIIREISSPNHGIGGRRQSNQSSINGDEYEDEDHNMNIRGSFLGQTRRQLYLHCLYRMMSTEAIHRKNEAKRTSIVSNDADEEDLTSKPEMLNARDRLRQRSNTMKPICHNSNADEQHHAAHTSTPHQQLKAVRETLQRTRARGKSFFRHHNAPDFPSNSSPNTPHISSNLPVTLHEKKETREGGETAKNNNPGERKEGGLRRRAYSMQYFEIGDILHMNSHNGKGLSLSANNSSEDNNNHEEEQNNRFIICISAGMKLFRRLAISFIGVLLGRHIHPHHHDSESQNINKHNSNKSTGSSNNNNPRNFRGDLANNNREEGKDKDIVKLQQEFSNIFCLQSKSLYFFTVEFALLLQCFYIALWATNFVVIAKDSYHPILWQCALVIPLPLNFFILKQIIYTSCLLKSIVSLDQYIANRICEEAIDERNVTQRLRKIIRETLKKDPVAMSLPKEEWPAYVKAIFDEHADMNDGMVDKKAFKTFLHQMTIYLTDKSVKRLFKVIDSDKDRWLHWDILAAIIFPENQKKKFKLRKRENSSGNVTFDYAISPEAAAAAAASQGSKRGSIIAAIGSVLPSVSDTIDAIRTNSRTSLVNAVRTNSRLSITSFGGSSTDLHAQQHAHGGGGKVVDRGISRSQQQQESISVDSYSTTSFISTAMPPPSSPSSIRLGNAISALNDDFDEVKKDEEEEAKMKPKQQQQQQEEEEEEPQPAPRRARFAASALVDVGRNMSKMQSFHGLKSRSESASNDDEDASSSDDDDDDDDDFNHRDDSSSDDDRGVVEEEKKADDMPTSSLALLVANVTGFDV